MDVVDRLQALFYKNLFLLPPNTPGYAVRVEFDRYSLSCTIFKLTLNWLAKVLSMPPDRFPRIMLNVALATFQGQFSLEKYNWLENLRRNFFSVIQEEDILENLNLLLDSRVRNSLVRKFIDIKKYNDWESCTRSSSLTVYPQFKFNSNRYLQLKNTLDSKKFLAQLRLLNKYNKRIIFRKKIYIIQEATCYYCNLSNLSIWHFILDCPLLHNLRTQFNLDPLNYDLPNKFDFLFGIIDESILNSVIKFFSHLAISYLNL